MVTTVARKKIAASRPAVVGKRQMGAGEFKAKCLRLIDEVSETDEEIVITKRGKPKAKLIPFRLSKKDPFFGRLKGIIEIVGDPDDLVNPTIPLEDWDMLK
jgi:prevent-host-death family protein